MGRGTAAELRRRGGPRKAVEPPRWGWHARSLYDWYFCEQDVVEALREEGWNVSVAEVRRHLKQEGVLRRRPLKLRPYSHPSFAPKNIEGRERRLEEEMERRRQEGDPDNAIYDWWCDELFQLKPNYHICYNDDPLFNSPEVVESITRRLIKWHRAVGRPVSGEGVEDLLGQAWFDVGFQVQMAPRNWDGHDTEVSCGDNTWIALSLKSENKRNPGRKIYLSSLAAHHQPLASAEDCLAAIREVLEHLARYQRVIYMRASGNAFDNGLVEDGVRYTILEVPRDDIARRLSRITAEQFAGFDFKNGNTFSLEITDERTGARLFRLSIARRPPRVSVTAIEADYCMPITSYVVPAPYELPRLKHWEV